MKVFREHLAAYVILQATFKNPGHFIIAGCLRSDYRNFKVLQMRHFLKLLINFLLIKLLLLYLIGFRLFLTAFL